MSSTPNPHTPPKWSINGNILPDIPDTPTHWEQFLEAEHIEEKDFKNNKKVLDFIHKYVRIYFIPTKVLRMYGEDWNDA
jgi:hypothetical protein